MLNNFPQYQAIIKTPIGKIGIIVNEKYIQRVIYLAAGEIIIEPQNQLAKNVATQLEQYFHNPAHQFNLLNLPLEFTVTPFQQKVLEQLQKIPTGKTQSYSDIATKLKTSARAVGNACRHNPFPIIIPCHRVVAKNNLGGYCGATDGINIEHKKWLLKHEAV